MHLYDCPPDRAFSSTGLLKNTIIKVRCKVGAFYPRITETLYFLNQWSSWMIYASICGARIS